MNPSLNFQKTLSHLQSALTSCVGIELDAANDVFEFEPINVDEILLRMQESKETLISSIKQSYPEIKI
ncbi:MAG TPA: hypothetical protein VIY47_16015 [Ignavibacteriaceae bacterium]